jgi:hypothetical protein
VRVRQAKEGGLRHIYVRKITKGPFSFTPSVASGGFDVKS